MKRPFDTSASKAPGKEIPGAAACRSPHERRGYFSYGRLPHYDADGLIQHVTFHLADSLPAFALERIDGEIKGFATEERKSEHRRRVQQWLDAGHGSCILAHPNVAEMVQGALLHFHGTRYNLHAWVVMPNHVHVLFGPLAEWPLGGIVASWKKFTARRIREFVRETKGVDREIDGPGVSSRVDQEIDGPAISGLVSRAIDGPRVLAGGIAGPGVSVGRVAISTPESKEPVWHREFWDRFIRDARHYSAAVEYIHANPVSAGLVATPEKWPWSSVALKRHWDTLP